MKRYVVIAVLALLVSTGYIMVSQNCKKESKTFRVGAALPLSGVLTSIGESSRAGLELAQTDVNKSFDKNNTGLKLELIVEDTASDPDQALKIVEKLYKKGARVIIGPVSSVEVSKVSGFASGKGVLIVSHGSTAISLAIPGDNVFRIVPSDAQQAKAISTMLFYDGVQAMIPIYRDDPCAQLLTGPSEVG